VITDPRRALAGLCVLVVDDDERMRDVVTSMLEHAGALVTACANGAEALDALKTAVPDVLVMDIGLPGPSGFSVMRTIRQLDDPAARAVPAIALSGYGDEIGLTPVTEAGFNDFLGKPIRMDRFLRAVGRAAGRAT
jgi:two-component system CheB/CheR fusion protein